MAIRCGIGKFSNSIFYIHCNKCGGYTTYYQPKAGKSRYIKFKSDGSYYGSDGPEEHIKGCAYKSISEIYYEDRGLNLMTPGYVVDDGIYYNMPDAILCGEDLNMGSSIHYLDAISKNINVNRLNYYTYRQVYRGYEKPFIFSYDGSYRYDIQGNRDKESKGCEYKTIGRLITENRAINLLSSSFQEETGEFSIMKSWPDVIVCGLGMQEKLFYLTYGFPVVRYSSVYDNDFLEFNQDGSFQSMETDWFHSQSTNCNNISISQLFANNQAKNLLKSKVDKQKLNLTILYTVCVSCTIML